MKINSYTKSQMNPSLKEKLSTGTSGFRKSSIKEQILVVDDTHENLKLVSDFLREAGFKVLIAKSGIQTLKILESAVPDLILLDVMMPEMNGFETCQYLKGWDKTKDIPIIFMTAMADASDLTFKVQGLTLGAVDYITKPIHLEEVLARVKIHLRLRSLTRQLQQEICNRKQAEAAIAQSEQKYRELVETSQDIIWSVDEQGNFTFINSAVKRIFGYEPQEMLGRPFSDFAPPEQVAADQAGLQYVLSGKSVFGYETKYLAKDGRPIYLLRNSIPKLDAEGRVMGATGTATDITARKKIEQELQQSEVREREKAEKFKLTLSALKRTQAQLIQAEKMSSLGRMVAGIAHEINNPISFIYCNLTPAREYFQNLNHLVELYQKTYPNPIPEIQQFIESIDLEFMVEDWQKMMASMQVGAERIEQIVLSLTGFSRLNESELKSVDIHEGIEDTLLILQNRLNLEHERGINSAIKVRKNYNQLPKIVCYPSQLNQVFMNILSNAIDALENQPEPRVITIRTSRITKSSQNQNSDFAVIKIADNGIGMSETVRLKIFDPFFTTKPVGSGTGLGLSISYQIVVEKHKGKISCISAPGKGTEIIVEIPINASV